ncbi:hypothetical protein EMCRGX_G019262 [Ephydatia muelleri]
MAESHEDTHTPFPHFGTLATHAGQDPDQWNTRAVVPPISLSSTFKQASPGKPFPYEYSRGGNPNRDVFEKCMASLENARFAIATSSGVAAPTLIAQTLESGDHIVCVDVYVGTLRYFKSILSRFGIQATFLDTIDLPSVEKAIQENTKMVWMEASTNPLLRMVDIGAVAKLAKGRKPDITVVIDNSFMTPYFLRPLDHGLDIVYYSVTKYLNGHTDVTMGVLCTNNDDLAKKLRFQQFAGGAVPSPFDCYLANRGLKTLHLRMREHQKNAFAVARFLQASPHVTEVMYPGLPSHPQHELAKRQCRGFSGMVSFRIKGTLENTKKFLESLKVFILAESFGGYGSLVDHPALMTHKYASAEERERIGVSDTLVRLSVGLEDMEDLLTDLEQALKSSQET